MRDNGIRGRRGYRLAQAVGLFAFFLSALLSLPRAFAQEKFDYDPLGRLIRYVDRSGYVTEYNYDGAGNILSVVAGAAVAPPSVSRVSASRLRRGTSLAMIVEGSGFSGARLDVQSDGVEIDDVSVSPARIAFSLSASLSAAVGPAVVRISNSVGEARIEVTVDPQLPSFAFLPIPIAIPPDGRNQNVAIELSNVDVHAHQFALTVDSPAVASVSPQLITVAAGQSRSTFAIKGLASGVTTLHARSPTLGDAAVPVFVTAEFAGLNTSHATTVGVSRKSAATPTPVGAQALSPAVNIAVGGHIASLAPAAWTVGQGPFVVTVNGAGLSGVSAVRIEPADNLSVGAPTVAPDGSAVSFPVTVAAGAALGPRRLVLDGIGSPYPALPGADRPLIVQPTPEITSIEPIAGVRGSGGLAFTVRGRNLRSVDRLSFEPGTGISVDESLTVSADGSTIGTRIGIADSAPAITHVVRAGSPAGMSSATPLPTNSFTVGEAVSQSVTPIAAATVGVRKASAGTPVSESRGAYSVPVRVAVGSHVESIAPASLVVGAGAAEVVIRGAGLSTVTAVRFEPSAGMSVSTPVVAADGMSVTVQVSAAANAEIGVRRVVLDGVGAPYLPVSPASDRLLVTYPQPEIESIEPILTAPGTVTTLNVRGRNLNGVTALRIEPGNGVAVASTLTRSGDGTLLSAGLSIAADAPAGAHIVRLVSPLGVTAAAGVANTLTVSGAALTPIPAMTAPLVGVRKAIPPDPTGGAREFWSPLTRVGVGPIVTALSPAVVHPGASVDIVIEGHGLQGVSAVLDDSELAGWTLGAPTVSADGTRVTVALTVSVNAPTGAHRMVLLIDGVAVPVLSPAASVVNAALPPNSLLVPSMVAPLVGVNRPAVAGPVVQGRDAVSPLLRVALPPYALRIDHEPLIRGATHTLTLSGAGLERLAGLSLLPADGASLGALTVAADGQSATVPLAVAADAAPTPRRLVPASAGTRIDFIDPAAAQLHVASGAPEILSIEPILAQQGESIELLIRGKHLHGPLEVVLEPAAGLRGIGTPSANAAGTEVRVTLHFAADAAFGGRVVRLRAAGGLSDGEASPANTLTVVDTEVDF